MQLIYITKTYLHLCPTVSEKGCKLKGESHFYDFLAVPEALHF